MFLWPLASLVAQGPRFGDELPHSAAQPRTKDGLSRSLSYTGAEKKKLSLIDTPCATVQPQAGNQFLKRTPPPNSQSWGLSNESCKSWFLQNILLIRKRVLKYAVPTPKQTHTHVQHPSHAPPNARRFQGILRKISVPFGCLDTD